MNERRGHGDSSRYALKRQVEACRNRIQHELRMCRRTEDHQLVALLQDLELGLEAIERALPAPTEAKP